MTCFEHLFLSFYYNGVSVAQSLVFCVVYFRPLLVFCPFFRQISVIFHSIAGVSLIASVIFRTFKGL
jgi:hypothetical protein